VTDHRIGFTIYNLPDFLDGDIADMIANLHNADQLAKLKGETEE
jgi:peptide chain release factor 1